MKLSSFIAPLKVNREHSNGPLVLIKALRFSSFAVASSCRVLLSVLSPWFVGPRQDSAMSVLYWMINKGKTNS